MISAMSIAKMRVGSAHSHSAAKEKNVAILRPPRAAFGGFDPNLLTDAQHVSPATFLLAAAGGVTSSLSPCSLSLLPLTIGYIVGQSNTTASSEDEMIAEAIPVDSGANDSIRLPRQSDPSTSGGVEIVEFEFAEPSTPDVDRAREKMSEHHNNSENKAESSSVLRERSDNVEIVEWDLPEPAASASLDSPNKPNFRMVGEVSKGEKDSTVIMPKTATRAALKRKPSAVTALAFSGGLVFTFTLLGVAAAEAGSVYGQKMSSGFLPVFAGAVAIAMGLQLLEVVDVAVILPPEVRSIEISRRLREMGNSGTNPRDRVTGAFATGAAFALTASPCTTPMLSALLAFCTTQHWVVSSALMMVYSIGFVAPLAVAAYFADNLTSLFPRDLSSQVSTFAGFSLLAGGSYVLMDHFYK